MAILTTNISVSNVTGLNRSLDVIALNIGSDSIELTQIIYFLDSNGDRIDLVQTPPYTIVSTADNSTYVDGATGLYVRQQPDGTWKYYGGPLNGQTFTGTPVPEYSFLMALLNTSVNIHNLIIQYIQLNDSVGKYNV